MKFRFPLVALHVRLRLKKLKKNSPLFKLLGLAVKKPHKWPRFPHLLAKKCIFTAFFDQLLLRSLTAFAIVPHGSGFSAEVRVDGKILQPARVSRDGKKIYRRIGKLDGS
jgi:hypothetical protein